MLDIASLLIKIYLCPVRFIHYRFRVLPEWERGKAAPNFGTWMNELYSEYMTYIYREDYQSRERK